MGQYAILSKLLEEIKNSFLLSEKGMVGGKPWEFHAALSIFLNRNVLISKSIFSRDGVFVGLKNSVNPYILEGELFKEEAEWNKTVIRKIWMVPKPFF